MKTMFKGEKPNGSTFRVSVEESGTYHVFILDSDGRRIERYCTLLSSAMKVIERWCQDDI